MVLDLSGLDFMDSAGARLLLAADLHARLEDRRLEILRAPAPVHRVVELCGLGDQLPFAD